LDEVKEFEGLINQDEWKNRSDYWEFIARRYRDSYQTWKAVALTLISILSFVLTFGLVTLLLTRI
jgi:hypothetical protein